MAEMEPSTNTEETLPKEATNPQPAKTSSEASSPKAPSLRSTNDGQVPSMTMSSAPLGPTNAARRPPPVSSASGLNSDYQKRIKELLASRSASTQNARAGLANGQQNFTGRGPNPPAPGGSMAPAAQGNTFPAGMRLPIGMSRPNAPSLSTPVGSPIPKPNTKGPVGNFSSRRGLKPGGMKLSDITKGPADQQGNQSPAQQPVTGSKFAMYKDMVDLNTGTLHFKNKAKIHKDGVDFESGSTFKISLDHVKTLGELGKGNYGTVFKVKHAPPEIRIPGKGLRGNMSRQPDDSGSSDQSGTNTSGRTMAMKELRLELEDTKFAQIIMELDILHRCVSPFIIDFYGAFFQEGSVYICIEYMDGGSIDKIYGDGVPEGVLQKITLSTVMGLKYLKDEHNIIHRDVKPTNILVNTTGQVKICDFGVSGNLVASIARTNIGCQSYMAPERISGGGIAQAGATGGGTYSVQSDIWSLGLSIIECALGRYPYPPETYNNIFSQLSAIVDGEPPDLPKEGYSETAHEFVRSCLNKVPGMRPTYAALLRHAWMSPLMLPPTISEDEEAEKAAEAGGDVNNPLDVVPSTADKEVASWVIAALEKKRAGKLGESAKPALHAAPLDAVAATSLGTDSSNGTSNIQPNTGIRMDSPELIIAKVHSLDFASGVQPESS